MGAVYRGGGRRPGRTRGPRKPRVEVRVGARGRALRIDGTFASWYAPGRAAKGTVWEALAAPLLLLPPARCRAVLVLGLGGGSAARVVRALAPRARIVGVERDPRVVRAARRWFDLDELGIELVEGDALRYLERARGRFDAVVEDVFVGQGRNVRKPDGLPEPGLALAARRLARGGLLVSNTIDESTATARAIRALCPALLAIGVRDYDNRVLVGAPRGATARALRSAVLASPVLAPAAPNLCFRTLAR